MEREIPSPVSWPQALVPIGLGIASLSVSLYAFIGVSVVFNWLGIRAGSADSFVKSMLLAFMTAGCPEELTKLCFILISIFLFRKKIRNVYEYILIGAAVGIGFTLPEEFTYGEGGFNLLRILTIPGHMVYGMIMAGFLGIAKYNKISGKPRFLQYVLAALIPMLLHTLYDACTSNNLMLLSEDSATSDSGIILGLFAAFVHFVGQFVILIW